MEKTNLRSLDLSRDLPHIARCLGDESRLELNQEVRAWGDFDVEERKKSFKVGVIGTRRPSLYGLEVVERLLRELAHYQDWIWVSGGAFGIDAEVHRVALKFGLRTQAWLVGPIENPSPLSHSGLFSQMKIKKGCGILVPKILEPASGHFVRPYSWLLRNRWLAADVDALVVVEAQEKSGTWNTTAQALDFGKETYLIPGSILNESSCGINQMISEGYGHGVVSLAHLTKSLVVLEAQRSYNYR